MVEYSHPLTPRKTIPNRVVSTRKRRIFGISRLAAAATARAIVMELERRIKVLRAAAWIESSSPGWGRMTSAP